MKTWKDFELHILLYQMPDFELYDLENHQLAETSATKRLMPW